MPKINTLDGCYHGIQRIAFTIRPDTGVVQKAPVRTAYVTGGTALII